MGGFVRLRADEVLSITGKYPKGAGGGQRVHVSWPPPDPPLLSYNAPLASQGRAQRSSHPFPGGPLSPSAQSIPSPGSWAPVYPWSDGQGLPRPGYLGRRLAAAYRPGKARAQRGAWGAWRRLRALLAHALQGQISPHPGGSIFLPGTPFPPGNSPVFPFTNGGFSATMKRSALEPCARAADRSDGVLGGRR